MNLYLKSNVAILVPPTKNEYINIQVYNMSVINLIKWILATVMVSLYPFVGFWTLVLLPLLVILFRKANRLAKKIDDTNCDRVEEIRFMKVA